MSFPQGRKRLLSCLSIVSTYSLVACINVLILLFSQYLNQHLVENDPEVYNIIEKEKKRQRDSIVLIPSEVRA